jgi:riboflavin kinase/FMN adenylyltransferase
MDLVRGSLNVRERHRGGIVTIGSFDGLHRGHLELIERTCDWAQRERVPAIMVTFEPMPREHLQPENPPPRLTSFRERWRLLERTRLDALVVLRFDERLRQLSGDEFIALLTERLAVRGIVIGHDFRFGRAGGADAVSLRAAGERAGFELQVVEPIEVEGERVSSTAVRSAVAAGDFTRAAQLLGRPYSMRGRVVAGAQLGRTLGFPTANMRLRRLCSPLAGIFAVRVLGIESRPLSGVASLGTRPTVAGVEPLLETFVFDFAGDLYGRELEVQFVAHLRDELRFESLDSMVIQMRVDERRARELV